MAQAKQTEVVQLYADSEYSEQIRAKSSYYTIASADGKPMLVADQVVTNLKERYNSILSLAAVPSITNGKGKLFSVVDTYIYWLMTMARAILVCISQKQLSM